MLTNILQYLEATAMRLPDKTAFSDGKDSLTFSKLHRLARGIGAIICRKGIYRRPIAILMEKHPCTLAACFGAVYAGCFYAVLDSSMPEKRIGLIIDTLEPALLIYDKKNEKLARALAELGIWKGARLEKENESKNINKEITV